jgi:hypothetical protein
LSTSNTGAVVRAAEQQRQDCARSILQTLDLEAAFS